MTRSRPVLAQTMSVFASPARPLHDRALPQSRGNDLDARLGRRRHSAPANACRAYQCQEGQPLDGGPIISRAGNPGLEECSAIHADHGAGDEGRAASSEELDG